MKIGLDLDSVLVDMEPLLKKAFKQTNQKYVKPIDWKMSNFPEETRKLVYQYFKTEKEMCSLKLFPGVYTKIHELIEDGDELFIITARNQQMDNINYIHNLFNDIDLFGKNIKIFVVGFNEPKVNILKENNIELWVDDCPNEIDEIKKAGIKVIMISNPYTKYNWYKRNQYEWFPRFIDIDFDFIKFTKKNFIK